MIRSLFCRHKPFPTLPFGMLLLFLSTAVRSEPLYLFEFSGDPGPYTMKEWKKDWPGCSYADGVDEGRASLVSRGNEETWLRLLYPRGSYGSDAGGAGWRYPFGAHEAAELRYAVRFDKDFDFVKGGKLPGLCGGPETISGGDAVNGLEGFSARLMWRKDGRGQAYVYHLHQPSKFGDQFDFPKDFRFVPGKAYAIRLRVDMNQAGKKDGELRIWVNDQLLVEKTNLQWRKKSDYGVDSILFNTFHGGGDKSWAPREDVWAEFGKFQVRILK